MKRLKNKKFMCLILICVIVLLLGLSTKIKVVNYNISSEEIQNKVKIAVLTDLHSCKYGENQEDLIKVLDAENPDVVLLVGDIYDDVMPNENTSVLLNDLSQKYPMYYVTGNHEYWSDDIDTVLNLISSFNIKILDGATETLVVNGQEINFCGITDPDVVTYTDEGTSIRNQLENLKDVNKNGNFTVLLAHRPELIETYKEYDFDLVVSGHAHGGQWRIPLILNGLYAPNQGFFPKYAGGFYEFENMDFIVSRGLAKESTRVPRFYNRPEVVIVEVE